MTSANLPTAWSEEAAGVAQGFHLREWVIGWLFGGECVDGIGSADCPGSCGNMGLGAKVVVKVLGIWCLEGFAVCSVLQGAVVQEGRMVGPQPPSAAGFPVVPGAFPPLFQQWKVGCAGLRLWWL